MDGEGIGTMGKIATVALLGRHCTILSSELVLLLAWVRGVSVHSEKDQQRLIIGQNAQNKWLLSNHP